MNKSIITVVGKDTIGIIASMYIPGREQCKHSGYLSDYLSGIFQHDDDCRYVSH